MITTRGFLTNKDVFFRKIREFFNKPVKAFPGDWSRKFKEFFNLIIHGTSGKGFFGNINTYEDFYGYHSSIFGFLRALARDCLLPILHVDKVFSTQPTYYGCGRQGTNSEKGSMTQVKWSSPALHSCSDRYVYDSSLRFLTMNSQ